MELSEFIEKEYQEQKDKWSLPPIHPKYKEIAIEAAKKWVELNNKYCLDDIRSEGKVLAICNNFINDTNKNKEAYEDTYMKGVDFVLSKISK